jgi:hypothetical protein
MSKQNTFRLIGRTNEFRVVKFYKAAKVIPCVYGVTLDGKFQTSARVADVLWLS